MWTCSGAHLDGSSEHAWQSNIIEVEGDRAVQKCRVLRCEGHMRWHPRVTISSGARIAGCHSAVFASSAGCIVRHYVRLRREEPTGRGIEVTL